MRKIVKKVNFYLAHLSGVALFLLMLLTVADVVLRFTLNRPIPGAFEITEVVIPLMVLFAAAHAHDNGDHVVIDIIYERLPYIPKWIISFISTLIYLAIVVLIGWRLYVHSGNLRLFGAGTSQLQIPHWPILLLGTVAMVGYVVSLILQLFYLIWDRRVLGSDAN